MRNEFESAMNPHPQIIERDGRKESVVLPDEESAASRPRLSRSLFQRFRPPVALAQADQLSAFSIYPRVLPHRHQPQRKLGTCLRNLFR